MTGMFCNSVLRGRNNQGAGHRLPAFLSAVFLILASSVPATPSAPGSSGRETVAVTEFLNEPAGDAKKDEWTELFNYGTAPVSLAGWMVSDRDTDQAALPDAVLGPGEFAILARDKESFEYEWLAGIPTTSVLQLKPVSPSGFRMSSGSDEIILKNAAGETVWQVAWLDAKTSGNATYLRADALTTSSASGPFNLAQAAPLTESTAGTIPGYERNDRTSDTLAFTSASGDVGSPLAGGYPGAVPLLPVYVIDTRAKGTPFNPGVRGMAIADNVLERTTYRIGIPDTLEVTTGSALRGVAAGLYADLYDWRTRNGEPRPTTLQFLRYARDARAELFITANTRGLVEPDLTIPNKTRYYDTSTATLSAMARDWVRYVNHIVPSYRQRDPVADPRDASILSMLKWNSARAGDTFDKLLRRDEAPVSRVTYWEIGNEPTVTTSGSIAVTNGYRVSPADYHERYKAIVLAMKAEDPGIKVGPCVVGGQPRRERDHLNLLLSDPELPVDFISYHPYQWMGNREAIPEIESFLGSVASEQHRWWQTIRDLVTSSGRSLDSVEMVASEVNVSYWKYNDTPKEGQMTHALGSVETVFTHARLGLTAAHYWIWPAHAGDGTRYPLFKAFEKLRDHMGDTLLDARSLNNSFRLYITRTGSTGATAVWGLNFSNSQDRALRFSLAGPQPRPRRLRFLTLGSRSGKTTLLSANLSPSMPGGPRSEVDWNERDLSGSDPENLSVTFPAATMSLLLIER